MKDKIALALAHFKKYDPVLFSIANKIEIDEIRPREPNQYFSALCREIIGQQLNKKAAATIFERFSKLFSKRNINPKSIIKLPEKKLREVGMAWSKVSFIKDLSEKVMSKSLDIKNLHKLNNEEATERLKSVKGVGPWTAEMFLMFTLGREDIFSYKDLGLKKAVTKIYELKKDASEKEINEIVEKWSPYKTYACRFLWRSLDNK
ncbi:MAG TPA: DNA-3-methyladenine glycosylase 2 family protein [archaeon]|nr:DNA-3-methyladenine glycosylase 2 family protein [archaeon]